MRLDTDYSQTKKTFNFAERRSLPMCFCSAPDGGGVKEVFLKAIDMAEEFRQTDVDFMSSVLDTLSFLDVRSAEKTCGVGKTEVH